MLNPFSWNHSLYYGEKMNLSDFDTKNPQSLDYLLKQMYMLGYKNGYLQMKNSLPALNAAYYVAVAIANTEGVDETNLEEEITTSIRTIWNEDFYRHHKGNPSSNQCPFAEMMLIEWMVYAILWLQESKSKEMEMFLELYVSHLMRLMPGNENIAEEINEQEEFLLNLPDMVSKWQYRYQTPLIPHPLHPNYYTDYMWTGTVSKFNINDMLWQLSFFPSPKEQHDFLDWAKKMSDKHKESDADDLPF